MIGFNKKFPIVFGAVIIFILTFSFSVFSFIYSPHVKISKDKFWIINEDKRISIPVYVSQDINKINVKTTHLLIMIHGGGLTANSYYKKGLKIVSLSKIKKENVLIIVPQFLEKNVTNIPDDAIFWNNDWREGGFSIKELFKNISSFEVLENLIIFIVQHSPNLKQISICGHSAGGQFVHRFSLLNKIHDTIVNKNIEIKYIIANPSSYLYLDEIRYQYIDTNNVKLIPIKELEKCKEYNTYKFGLDYVYGYARNVEKHDILENAKKRKLIFLVGQKDINIDETLDQDCAANIQGKNRYERGLTFKYYLKTLHIINNKWIEIPDVAHDATGMFTHKNIPEKIIN